MSKQFLTEQLTVVEAESDDVFSDMARVHLDHRPFAKAGKIVVIKCGDKTAYVVARGSSGNVKGKISLDSATREKLGVKPNQKVELTIEETGFVGQFLWAWNATDAMPRVGARLGAISVLLGLLGLILGGVSLIVTFCQQASSASGS